MWPRPSPVSGEGRKPRASIATAFIAAAGLMLATGETSGTRSGLSTVKRSECHFEFVMMNSSESTPISSAIS